MVIALDDKWIWDAWYAHDGAQWHAYFLQADKSIGDPEARHWYVSQGHAVSSDLKNWSHLGTCFAPSERSAWDDMTTWTGSVVQDDDGGWHLFYTGSTRAENGLKQRIGHAVSADMHSWRRVGDGLALDLSGNDYEEYTPGHWHDRAMRDPWVMRDPDGGWVMYFTARVPNVAEPNAGGAIGFATSPDLMVWTLQPPVFQGGFGQLEVPQVFAHDGQWYCLFCTADQHWSQAYTAASPTQPVTGTHYLMSDNPRGPWRIAPGPFLDGSLPCKRYAARVVRVGRQMFLLGFAYWRNGDFVGQVMDPVALGTGPDGLLHLCEAVTRDNREKEPTWQT